MDGNTGSAWLAIRGRHGRQYGVGMDGNTGSVWLERKLHRTLEFSYGGLLLSCENSEVRIVESVKNFRRYEFRILHTEISQGFVCIVTGTITDFWDVLPF